MNDRADINNILDDFLENYRIKGKKLEPSLVAMLQSTNLSNDMATEDPLSQLENVRRQMRDIDPNLSAEENKQRILARAARMEEAESRRRTNTEQIEWESAEDKRKNRWDCETVLSALFDDFSAEML